MLKVYYLKKGFRKIYYLMCTFYTLSLYVCKQITLMKKLSALLILVLGMVSCKKEITNKEVNLASEEVAKMTSINRLGANEKVKLLKSKTVATYYSSSLLKEKAFYVEVAKSGLKRQVFVYHKMSNNTWKNFPLKYLGLAADSTKLLYGWEFNYGVGTPLADSFATVGFSDQFAIKYVVDGQVNWDNNNGINYSIANPVATDGMFLQDGLHVSADTYHSSFSTVANGNRVQIFADLRNLAFAKEVTLIYTTNNWVTVKNAPFSFANTYAYGGSNYSVYPNVKNFEKWMVNITPNIATVGVKYAIRYKVNGVEYWDNNYGRNYLIKRK